MVKIALKAPIISLCFPEIYKFLGSCLELGYDERTVIPSDKFAYVCIEIHEFHWERRPYQGLRSLSWYISPLNEVEALLLRDYAAAIQDAIEIGRAYRKGRTAQNGALEVTQFFKKEHPAVVSAVDQCREMEKSFPNLSGFKDSIDSLVPLPLYRSEDLASRRGFMPDNSPGYQSFQVVEPWYLLYRGNLWKASSDVLFDACVASIDKFYAPKAPVVAGGRRGISEAVRVFVWRRDEGKCTACGSRDKLEFDHIIPFVKGGSDTARNIELLCEKCNRSKSSKIK